jgi:hypothetical protein
MLALFLNHSLMFVAGEVALGLSLALFFGALMATLCERASSVSRSRDAGHPDGMIVRRFADETVHARSNVPGPALVTSPVVRSRPGHRSS